MIQIVPSTRQHILELYKDAPVTVRAISAIKDGNVIGIAGIYKSGARDVAFVKTTGEISKKEIVLGARKFFSLFGNRIMFAIKDNCLDTADSFIRHFGFKELENGVYIWKA